MAKLHANFKRRHNSNQTNIKWKRFHPTHFGISPTHNKIFLLLFNVPFIQKKKSMPRSSKKLVAVAATRRNTCVKGLYNSCLYTYKCTNEIQLVEKRNKTQIQNDSMKIHSIRWVYNALRYLHYLESYNGTLILWQ